MRFEGQPIPGATYVKIENITNKDGSPLSDDNWRRERIGMITICYIAGGLKKRTPFFKRKAFIENGEVIAADLSYSGNASTSTNYPVEVESGVFDFETNTSIYRFRLLTEEEEELVSEAFSKEYLKMVEVWESIQKSENDNMNQMLN